MRKPDYARGPVKLWLGDCLELLPQLEPGSVDAVVTDPPYGAWLARNNGKRGTLRRSEYLGSHVSFDGATTTIAGVAGRLCEPIYGDDRPFDPSPLLRFPCVLWGANWFASKIPDGGGWHVWDKRGGIKSNNFADAELVWCSKYQPTRIFRHVWIGMIRDSHEKLLHPTQKPAPVMRWSLSLLADAETVFDPYCGSGTTIIAAIRTGRRAWGIEIDPHYFEVAVKRIDAELDQPNLPGM